MKFTSLFAVIAMTCGTIAASAQVLVVNRPLPVTNINNAAGSNRSNVDWGDWGYDMSGDTLIMPTVSGSNDDWTITHVRMWFDVDPTAYDLNYNQTATSNLTDPGDLFQNINLYWGNGGTTDPVSIVDSANFTGSLTTDDANVTVQKTHFANGDGYQTNSGAIVQIYQVDFSGLNISAQSGGNYGFALSGTSKDANGGSYGWFNEASNGPLGGSPADSDDDFFRYYYLSDGSVEGIYNSAAPDGGWDKTSNINIQVWATQAVPEPSEFGFLAIAGLGLISAAKKKIRRS